MDPIAASRIFANQLRQRLTDRARLAAKAEIGSSAPLSAAVANPKSVLAAYVDQHGTPDHDARRVLVEQLLANRFGHSLLNDAKFQHIVNQVTTVMEGDPELLIYMTEVLAAVPDA